MKRFVFKFFVCAAAVVGCVSFGVAQKKANVRKAAKIKVAQKTRIHSTRKTNSKRKSISQPKILSAGVVNGRAIDLVKPEFPPAARMVGVYGQVVIQVLIDEEGNVEKAEATAGNPLIEAASVAAARASKFQSFTLGEQAVKVRGIIVYDYLPESFNWLEIGYILRTLESENFHSFYTFENLIKCFPSDFEDEKQLVESAWQNWENRQPTMQTVFAMVEGKLSAKPKEIWLFSLGKVLAKVSFKPNSDPNANRDALQLLRSMVESVPENISKTLVSDLQQLTFLPENSEKESEQILSGIIRRMPYWGR